MAVSVTTFTDVIAFLVSSLQYCGHEGGHDGDHNGEHNGEHDGLHLHQCALILTITMAIGQIQIILGPCL